MRACKCSGIFIWIWRSWTDTRTEEFPWNTLSSKTIGVPCLLIYISDFGTRQIIFGDNMNAIGNHFLYQVRGQISCILTHHRCVLWSCIRIPPFWMCFYSIHAIDEYNLSGSEIICRQIYAISHRYFCIMFLYKRTKVISRYIKTWRMYYLHYLCFIGILLGSVL